MKPTPQASFSRDGCQRPWGSGQPSGDFCDVGIEVIEEIEIRRAGSPRKVVNRENRRKNRSGIALESLINQGFPMTAEETGGNLLSAGGAVKTGGVVRRALCGCGVSARIIRTGFNQLARLHAATKDLFFDTVELDFSLCSWFDANMAAPLWARCSPGSLTT